MLACPNDTERVPAEAATGGSFPCPPCRRGIAIPTVEVLLKLHTYTRAVVTVGAPQVVRHRARTPEIPASASTARPAKIRNPSW